MANLSTIPGIACVHTQQHMDSSFFVCVCFFLRNFVNALSLSSTTHKKIFLHQLVNKTPTVAARKRKLAPPPLTRLSALTVEHLVLVLLVR
jgi:hypothetical protein